MKETKLEKWRCLKDGYLNEEGLTAPRKWRDVRLAVPTEDIFAEAVTNEMLDLIFAEMASAGQHVFRVATTHITRKVAYFERIAALAPAAGADYEKRMRAHFEKYKQEFMEGYSLPSPPTPELRVLYDSACEQEQRKLNPDGTTLWNKGFSGGEYHWRSWPLNNVFFNEVLREIKEETKGEG